MLDLAIPIQVAVQIGLPMLVGLFLVRRYGRPDADYLRIFVGGAVGFGAAQATLFGLTQIIVLAGLPSLPATWERVAMALGYGVAIGVLEELARFAVLRLWLRDVRSWAEGLMLGVGHGGAESVFGGMAALVWFMTMQSLRASPPAGQEITEAEKAHLDEILAAYWSTPWQAPLLSALQQVFMLVLAVGLASLVMRVFLTGRLVYLPAAMGLHDGATATMLYIGQSGIAHALLVGAVLAALGLVIAWRMGASVLPAMAASPPVLPDAAPTAKRRPSRPRKKRTRRT